MTYAVTPCLSKYSSTDMEQIAAVPAKKSPAAASDFGAARPPLPQSAHFAAGMSGGVAYVYDEDGQFDTRCNLSMVTLERILPATEQEATVPRSIWHNGQTDEAQLKKLLEDHNRWTGSKRARELLDNWAASRSKFVKVFPTEYKRALAEIYERKVLEESATPAVAATKKEVAPAK